LFKKSQQGWLRLLSVATTKHETGELVNRDLSSSHFRRLDSPLAPGESFVLLNLVVKKKQRGCVTREETRKS
jgi:hypothetical protein